MRDTAYVNVKCGTWDGPSARSTLLSNHYSVLQLHPPDAFQNLSEICNGEGGKPTCRNGTFINPHVPSLLPITTRLSRLYY